MRFVLLAVALMLVGTPAAAREPQDGFVIESVGSSSHAAFSDEGIEYYRYLG